MGPLEFACVFIVDGACKFATLSRSTGKSGGGDDMRNSALELGICSPISTPVDPGGTCSGPLSRSLGGPIGLPRAATK